MTESAWGAFFGAPWDAPRVDSAVRVDTPVGERCLMCSEEIVEGDRGWLVAALGTEGVTRRAVHAECDLRSVIGHTVGVCGCHGFRGSAREAARETWERVGQKRGRPLEDLSALSAWQRAGDGWERKRTPRET